MLRSLYKLLGLALLIAAGSLGIYEYVDHVSAQHRIQQLEEQKKELQQIVQRLGDERRVAEMLVTDQKRIGDVLHTTLLFKERARDQSSLPSRAFELLGDQVHIDAMVIKFDRGFVQQDDPLRGHSIALFTRIYGDRQTPAQAERIDSPDQIPDVYRGADPRAEDFEKELWSNFWHLADDKDYAQSKGVRIANGQGVWGPFAPGRLYTLTLEADGGLNLVSEPQQGIYHDALQRAASEPSPPTH